MRRKAAILFGSSMLTATDRRRFNRRLRDNEGHDTGVAGAGGNNGGDTGGNNGDSGASGSGDNNGGQGFDAVSFWNGPASGNDGDADNASSGTGGNQGSDTQGQGGTQGGGFQEQLTERLSSLNFGASVMTPDVISGINNGDFGAFHTNLNNTLQNVVRESLGMNVQILKEYGSRLRDQILAQVNGNIEGRDDQAQLVKDFPSAADPKVAPAVRQIFAQALKNTNGNRAAAVTQTKSMLSIIASTTGTDLGLDVAPAGQGDNRPSRPQVKDWLEELSGR